MLGTRMVRHLASPPNSLAFLSLSPPPHQTVLAWFKAPLYFTLTLQKYQKASLTSKYGAISTNQLSCFKHLSVYLSLNVCLFHGSRKQGVQNSSKPYHSVENDEKRVLY